MLGVESTRLSGIRFDLKVRGTTLPNIFPIVLQYGDRLLAEDSTGGGKILAEDSTGGGEILAEDSSTGGGTATALTGDCV